MTTAACLPQLREHQARCRPARRPREITQSGIEGIVDVAAIVTVDQVIEGFHERPARISQEAGEVARDISPKSLGNVARRGRARIADLITKLEISRRRPVFRPFEYFAFQLMRQLPTDQILKTPDARHALGHRTARATKSDAVLRVNDAIVVRSCLKIAKQESLLPVQHLARCSEAPSTLEAQPPSTLERSPEHVGAKPRARWSEAPSTLERSPQHVERAAPAP